MIASIYVKNKNFILEQKFDDISSEESDRNSSSDKKLIDDPLIKISFLKKI